MQSISLVRGFGDGGGYSVAACSLQKAVSDSAYLHTIEQLLEEKRGQISDFEADQYSR